MLILLQVTNQIKGRQVRAYQGAVTGKQEGKREPITCLGAHRYATPTGEATNGREAQVRVERRGGGGAGERMPRAGRREGGGRKGGREGRRERRVV